MSERYDREEESRRLKERREASPRADPSGRQRAATEGSLLALSAVSGVLALLVVPFIGGAMDGAWGPGRAADNRR